VGGVGSATNGAFLQIGGALEVAARADGVLGAGLGHLARAAFASGMDLGLTVGTCVAAAGCLVALLTLPSREPPDGKCPDDE
jgi:hypothetical protein